MIIGSTSGGGIFVCSETHYLPYMNLRPFRETQVQSIPMFGLPDHAAEYLSDLKQAVKSFV